MRARRAAVWLLCVPLMVAGSQTAHVLAYRIVYPESQVRLHDLLSTGHSYMVGHPAWIALALGVLGAFQLLGLAWTLVSAFRGRTGGPRVPPWAFALLPLIGFTLQEFLERWLVGAPFPWWFVLQPTFRIGLLLQLPFGVAAYVVARLLLRATERLAERFVAAVPPRLVAFGAAPAWRAIEAPLRSWLFAVCHFGRGPPAGVLRTAFA